MQAYRWSRCIWIMIAFLYLTACARPSALNLAPRAAASVEASIGEDLEVVVARQTIEGALINSSVNSSVPAATATPLPPTVGVATPDLDATATREAQQLALAVVTILAQQPTPTPAVDATQTHAVEVMATAVAATLTAQPQPTSIPTSVASPAAGAVAQNPVDGATLVYIAAGEFTMGLTDAQINDLVAMCAACTSGDFTAAKPVHPVYLRAFWIYRTEITNRMYAQCVRAGMCKLPAQTSSATRADYWDNPLYADYPVVYVDWFAADQYCRWAGGRLPTAAEWEKAARGVDGRLFPWGNSAPNASLANTKGVMGDTTPVASYPQGESVYGVQDMAGNVWEWVADWHEPDYYHFSVYENPVGPETSRQGRRSGRGGSWFWAAGYASSAHHDWWEPGNSDNGVGFRCAIELN